MAKKAKSEEQDGSILESAAKLVGTAAGKVAAAVGVGGEEPKVAKKKVPKLTSKNKSRLPRKQKKAQQKATSR